MKKNYFVEVKALCPYPVNKTYTLLCNSAGTAINRSIRLYRKDIGKKRLYTLTVRCDLLKGANSQVEVKKSKASQIEAIKATPANSQPIQEFSIGLDR